MEIPETKKTLNIAGKNKDPKTGFFFQPRLTINTLGDEYEREADAKADKVMGMPVNDRPFFSQKPISVSQVQRKCAHCEEEEKKGILRKEVDNNEAVADHSAENYISSLNGKGQSLTSSQKKFFEPRFGYDFSEVKIHNNPDAVKSSRSINALAYTTGNNIVFNENQFSPETDSGKKLLAHELTHVVQQNKSVGQKSIQRQDKDADDKNLQITKRIELPAPQDKLSTVVSSPENKKAENEDPHPGIDFSTSLSANPPRYPHPETYGFSLVYRDLNLKSFGKDDAAFAVDIFHEPNLQITLSPDPHNAQLYQAAATLINLHFRRHKNDFIEAGLGLGGSLNPSGILSGQAQVQVEWHVTSRFSVVASSGISVSKHDDTAPIDYSSVLIGTAKGADWSWAPVSVGMVWHLP